MGFGLDIYDTVTEGCVTVLCFGSETDPMSLLIIVLVVLLANATSSKKLQALSLLTWNY